MKLLNTIIFLSLLTYANAELVRQSDNIVKDNKTNFLWQDSNEVKTIKKNFDEAKKYCKNLTVDGQNGWKLPGFLELFSIVDAKVYNPTLSKKFNNFASDNYWSAKTFSHGMSKEAFVVNYLNGAFNREKMKDKFFVRCYKNLNI